MNTHFAESILATLVADLRRYDDLVDRLQGQGYTANFVWVANEIRCVQDSSYLALKAIRVDQIYPIRVNEISPQYYLYALAYPPTNQKGLFLIRHGIMNNAPFS
ncbi:hypothetical protein WBG78_27235 [Chryseolinea sp. T2]|uniref:hypothetical protein n=1 Tax=Chryseolinea sp. T2 TaxID=3129255 RepID=UPI0030786ECD